MTGRLPILVFGSLPPFRSAAAALGLSTAEALAADHDITFVIDDLAPAPPADLTFSVIRIRDLRANWGTYETHRRLYIPGADGDSLFPLELLRQAPGIVMPATLSLFPLAESTCRATGLWPDAYWQWLKDSTGAHAKALYAARVHHRRESLAQGTITPALDLLLAPATALVAASPAMARMMTASSLTPSAVLDMAPAPETPSTAKGDTSVILYVTEEAAAAQTCRASLSVFPAFESVSHLSVHPAARHLAASIAEADIVAFLDGHDHASSPGLAVAACMGKAIITARQPWAQHLPTGSHIALPHGKAHDTLATSVAALLAQPGLMNHFVDHRTKAGVAASLAQCLQDTEVPSADLSAPRQESVEKTDNSTTSTLAGSTRTAALIGAVPPPAILQELLPQLDINRCPRFCTPALASRLADLTGEAPASLLARIGYEAPLIFDGKSTHAVHRTPVTFGSLKHGLKAKTAISFGCSLDEGVDGDKLLDGAGIAPKLALRIDYDEKDRNAPTQGFLPEYGLFWSHDTVRHALQCVIVVGHRLGTFRLKAGVADTCFMVAGHDCSTAVSGGTAATLTSDQLGLLEFKLMALDNSVGTPLASEDLRKQLAQAGLLLEWSAV
ncbi:MULTISPECIES: hypothetical protein [Kordiimonas]|jgi:hypothetical protein|uniref:hypothetical protein n=1 Tax=Kordiimonas TaxID=288021 RepID=UPI00257F38D8|nr:hypothetical protein [Kordiimonas sp. UBA4487]